MKNVAIIPESVEEKDALIRALLEENAQLKQQYFRVLEQFKLAQQRHFARSSESNILQMDLQFDEAEAVPPEALPQEDNTITVTYTRGKPKRCTLPEDLPREVIEHDIPEHDKLCVCGCMKQRIGEENRINTSTSYMWVYRTAKPDKKVVLFDYRETRQARWPKEILHEFKGYLQTDGYSGYDWLDDNPNIIHLGCMSHARRPFAELVKLAKTTGKSHQAVAYFQKLYAIEKIAREAKYTTQQRYTFRLEKSKLILDEMKLWMEQSLRHAVPQSKLENALNYMNQRWQQLTNFLLDGSLEIDNNGVENQIRPFAVGRKNWLFSGSPRGAQASALFYSLIATAVANGWNPFDYLRYLFENIRLCKTNDDYIGLLPFNINLNNR